MSRLWKRLLVLVVTLVGIAAHPVWAQEKSKFIPPCALRNTVEGECRDISIFVTLLINIAKYLFSIVGALALLFFVYGGFVLILSQGNPEKVKKGKDIFGAAVIGLIIVFGAYMLVRFLASALGVQQELQLK